MDLGEIIAEHPGYTQHVDTHVEIIYLKVNSDLFLYITHANSKYYAECKL